MPFGGQRIPIGTSVSDNLAQPMTVRFGVENVAISRCYASSYSGDGIVTTGAPRTYLVSVTVNV